MGKKKRIQSEKRKAEQSSSATIFLNGRYVSLGELAAEWEKVADNIKDDASLQAAGNWMLDIAMACLRESDFSKLVKLQKLVYSTGSHKAADIFTQISNPMIAHIMSELGMFPKFGFAGGEIPIFV